MRSEQAIAPLAAGSDSGGLPLSTWIVIIAAVVIAAVVLMVLGRARRRKASRAKPATPLAPKVPLKVVLLGLLQVAKAEGVDGAELLISLMEKDYSENAVRLLVTELIADRDNPGIIVVNGRYYAPAYAPAPGAPDEHTDGH